MTIDLATAKAHLRVDTLDEDALITAYLSAAKGSVERSTGKKLTSGAVTQQVSGFPPRGGPLSMWYGPVTAIVSVAYDDAAGAEQTLADFRLVEGVDAKLLPAFGDAWPSTAPGPGAVRITYTAGYAADEVPPALDQAVLLLVGHWYANREAVSVGNVVNEFPLGVEMLLAPHRGLGIA